MLNLVKKIKEEVKNRVNIIKFDVADWVTEDSEILNEIRKVAQKHFKRSTLVRDCQYKALVKLGAIKGFKINNFSSPACGHNIVPTCGRTIMARILRGDDTYSGDGAIDYGALGTGASPSFSNSDTILDNEVYRKQASDRHYDNNIVYIDWFIASGDVADQTFTEFGAFIDGTASTDSGSAFSLYATGDWVKSGAMYISAKYTIS